MDEEALSLRAPHHTAKSQHVSGVGAITERPTQANPTLLGDRVLTRHWGAPPDQGAPRWGHSLLLRCRPPPLVLQGSDRKETV